MAYPAGRRARRGERERDDREGQRNVARVKKILRRMLARTDQAGAAGERRRRIDVGQGHPLVTIYAIGDVHGRIDLLQGVEEKIIADARRSGRPSLIVMLGDYVDRGPDSAAVLDHLCAPLPGGIRRLMLCGNHDAAFAEFVEDPGEHLQWLDFGGRQTLLSYGIDSELMLARGRRGIDDLREALQNAVPSQHLDLIERMPVYARIGPYLFVHAGVRPGVPLEAQTDEDLMWIREPFLSQGPKLPYVVIHGHTPSAEPTIGPGRIGIDTGAFATGKLTVLRIREGKTHLLT